MRVLKFWGFFAAFFFACLGFVFGKEYLAFCAQLVMYFLTGGVVSGASAQAKSAYVKAKESPPAPAPAPTPKPLAKSDIPPRPSKRPPKKK